MPSVTFVDADGSSSSSSSGSSIIITSGDDHTSGVASSSSSVIIDDKEAREVAFNTTEVVRGVAEKLDTETARMVMSFI